MSNMKKIYIFFLWLTFVCPSLGISSSLFAQNLSAVKEAQIMLQVVDLFEEYERYAGIDEDFTNYASSLRALFVNGDAPVYNDLMGLAQGQSLPISEYVKAMSTSSSTTRIEIKNISRKSINADGGNYKIVCTFDKYVNLTSTCGVEFSSDFFNATDYKLEATIVYNSEENNCRFEKIDGSVETLRVLEDNYRVIKTTGPRDNDVLYNGKPLEFNAMGQAFVGAEGIFHYKDPEIKLKVVEDNADCRLYHLAYKSKPFRVKVHYDMGYKEAYDLKGTSLLGSMSSSSDSYGLDLGVMFPSKSGFRVGFFLGAGLAKSRISLGCSFSDYTFSTTEDVDGDTYARHYQNLNIEQVEKLTDVYAPVYFDFNIRFGKVVSMYFDLGARVDYNLSREIESQSGSADVYGQYNNSYGSLILDGAWGFNGFGHLDISEVEKNINLEKAKLGISALGAAGLRFNIPKTPLTLDFGASYLYGITDVLKSNQVFRRSGTSDAVSTMLKDAIIYNTIDGMNSTEHIRELSSHLNSVKRKALMFNFGIICKF